MANKKFSQFSNVSPTATTFVVGYDGSTNVRIASNLVERSIDNIAVPKGLCKFPLLYGGSPTLVDQGFNNARVRFHPAQMIQIYQDTVISEIRYHVLIASATDEWYVGLYKYDLPGDKYVKQCQWDITSLGATGAISQSLGSPITIGPGTYFIGVKSKDFTAEGVGIAATDVNKPQIMWHTAATDISLTTSRVNGFQITVAAALTVLPTEIANSSVTYFRSSYPQFVPYLAY